MKSMANQFYNPKNQFGKLLVAADTPNPTPTETIHISWLDTTEIAKEVAKSDEFENITSDFENTLVTKTETLTITDGVASGKFPTGASFVSFIVDSNTVFYPEITTGDTTTFKFYDNDSKPDDFSDYTSVSVTYICTKSAQDSFTE